MHRFALSAAIGLTLLSAGCNRSDKVDRHFPAWASAQCHSALNEARNIIERIGLHGVVPKSVRVEFVPGTAQYNGMWAWREYHPSFPGGSLMVTGVCSGSLVKVGIDPNRATDPSAINMLVLIHEFVHHWLMRNGHGHYHYADYDAHVTLWRRSREVVGFATQSITVDGIHYDVVGP